MFIILKFPKLNFYHLKLISIIPSLKKKLSVLWLNSSLLLPIVNPKSVCFSFFPFHFCQIFSSLMQHFLAIYSAAILTYNPSLLTGICAQNLILSSYHGVFYPNTHPNSHQWICFSPCYWWFLRRNILPKAVDLCEISRFRNLCEIISNAVSHPV